MCRSRNSIGGGSWIFFQSSTYFIEGCSNLPQEAIRPKFSQFYTEIKEEGNDQE